MQVLYVPKILQWCSILCSQADVSGATDLCHSKGTHPTRGELVHSFTGKNASEHQIIHRKLPTMPEHLSVPCILDNCFPSSLDDEVNIITSDLVMCDFVVCLDTEGVHGDF
jgi:hypothetical protein